jgi:hypothetical protein
MIYHVRKIDVWSVMKVAFVIFGILGVIVGLFYAVFFAFMSQMLADFGGPGELGRMTGLFSGFMGIFMAFFLAIFYAVIGSLMTALFAGIYNLLARGIGGIELHLEPRESPPSPSPTPSLSTE